MKKALIIVVIVNYGKTRTCHEASHRWRLIGPMRRVTLLSESATALPTIDRAPGGRRTSAPSLADDPFSVTTDSSLQPASEEDVAPRLLLTYGLA
jgi:hypothetical protein